MKYIDADKLIAEVKRYKQDASIARFDNAGENADYFQGKVDLCNDLTHIIASLQQEQPEELHFTPLNRLIQKIPSENWNDTVNNYAKKLCDCLTKEGYLKDAAVLQGYISYMNGDNVPMATMDEQEQPEVDLEEYLSAKLVFLGADLIRHGLYSFNRGVNAGMTKAYDDILKKIKARK